MQEDFGRIMDNYKSINYGWLNCTKSDINLKFCQQISPNLDYPQAILKHGNQYSVKNLMNISRIDSDQIETFLKTQAAPPFTSQTNLNQFLKEMKTKQVPVFCEIEGPDYYEATYQLQNFLGHFNGHFSYNKDFGGYCYREGIKVEIPIDFIKQQKIDESKSGQVHNMRVSEYPQTALKKFISLNNHRVIQRAKLDQLGLYFDELPDFKILLISINERSENGKNEVKILKNFLVEKIKNFNQNKKILILFANKAGGSWKKWLRLQKLEGSDNLIDFAELLWSENCLNETDNETHNINQFQQKCLVDNQNIKILNFGHEDKILNVLKMYKLIDDEYDKQNELNNQNNKIKDEI